MNKLLVFGCGKKAEEISRYIDKKRNKILFYIAYELKVLNKKITLSYGFMVSLSCNT